MTSEVPESKDILQSEDKTELATKFAEQRQSAIGLLRGKRTETQWAYGIDPETTGITAALVKINRLGLMTLSSQPGMITRTEPTSETKSIRQPWAARHGGHVMDAVENEHHMIMRQRAFLECICMCRDMTTIRDFALRNKLWIHSDVTGFNSPRTSVSLTETTIATHDGYEAVVVDTRSKPHESPDIMEKLFGTMFLKLSTVMLIDPLFGRKSFLLDTLVAELEALHAKKGLVAQIIPE